MSSNPPGRPDPDPRTVAMILDGYGEAAAAERWPEWSARALRRRAEIGRQLLKRQSMESGRGQSARRLDGIVPVALFRRPEAHLSPDDALRECGVAFAREARW